VATFFVVLIAIVRRWFVKQHKLAARHRREHP
jgi:hypothetical protein